MIADPVILDQLHGAIAFVGVLFGIASLILFFLIGMTSFDKDFKVHSLQKIFMAIAATLLFIMANAAFIYSAYFPALPYGINKC